MKVTIEVEASLACVRMYGTATTTHLARTHVIVVRQIRFVLIPRNHPSLSISECRSIINNRCSNYYFTANATFPARIVQDARDR